MGGYRLWLRFDDGAEGEVDLSEVISLDGVFSASKEPVIFQCACVHPVWGTLCWPGDLALAPEALYERATGRSLEAVALSRPVQRTVALWPRRSGQQFEKAR